MAFSRQMGLFRTWVARVSGVAVSAIAVGTLSAASPMSAMAQPLPTQSDDELVTSFTALGGQVTIEFNNETGAPLTYEVLGITEPRVLPPEQSVLLQNIPLDATVTAVRNDNGLIDITGSGGETGQLSLSIVREVNFDDTQGVIIIEASGRVFAY